METLSITNIATSFSYATISTTILNNITTIIPATASATVDYTVTITEDTTATTVETVTETETETVTEEAPPVMTPAKRSADNDDEYDIPDYAAGFCSDIYQYSSACDCVGFVPGTSTAPAPSTTKTITTTVTPSTQVIISTVEAVPVTVDYTTVPVTTTVTTETISRPVETVTERTTVATDTLFETTTTTATTTTFTTPEAPPPSPTYTAYLRGTGDIYVEDIRVPPGAEIGVIVTIRQTATPARFVLDGADNSVALLQTPAVPYKFFIYERNVAFSYVQLTTERVAGILGVTPLRCSVPGGLGTELLCSNQGRSLELWLCGRHLAAVEAGYGAVFASSCANGATRITIDAVEQFGV